MTQSPIVIVASLVATGSASGRLFALDGVSSRETVLINAVLPGVGRTRIAYAESAERCPQLGNRLDLINLDSVPVAAAQP